MEGEDAFEVEKIIGKRTFGRKKHIQYRVKWKGYPESESTWEFMQDLIDDNCEKAIEEFESSPSTHSERSPSDQRRIHSSLPETLALSEIHASSDSSSLSKRFAYDQKDYAERPVNFESRVTRDYESKYESLELELSCLVWAVLKSVKYIEGNDFTVYTDHANINTVLRSKTETLYSRQVDRFRMLLMPYLSNMEIKHRPGKLHHNVDALSRLSDDEPETTLLIREGHVARSSSS